MLARGWVVATPFPGDVSSPGLSLSRFSCLDPLGICVGPSALNDQLFQVLLKQQFLKFNLVYRLGGASFIRHSFGNYVPENGICQDARKGRWTVAGRLFLWGMTSVAAGEASGTRSSTSHSDVPCKRGFCGHLCISLRLSSYMGWVIGHRSQRA